MFTKFAITNRLAAAASALALSAAMIAATVTVPATADSAQFAAAYVSVLA